MGRNDSHTIRKVDANSHVGRLLMAAGFDPGEVFKVEFYPERMVVHRWRRGPVSGAVQYDPRTADAAMQDPVEVVFDEA